jgi:2-haloacid dehalogenase
VPRLEAVITAVVWDIGGVLMEWDPRHLFRRLFDDHDEMERFLGEICTPEWHAALDRGVPYERACAELAERHPEYEQFIWAWGTRREEMVVGLIGDTIELLRSVKQRGVACYALTNMEADAYPARARRYEFFGWFDGTVVSSSEGVIKPDPAIFRRLFERFELEPSATVMIDDQARNIETARGLGMQTVHYRSPAQLGRSLEQLGVLGSTDQSGPPSACDPSA